MFMIDKSYKGSKLNFLLLVGLIGHAYICLTKCLVSMGPSMASHNICQWQIACFCGINKELMFARRRAARNRHRQLKNRDETKRNFTAQMKGKWKTCVGAFVIMFHSEQTCWASQREEIIDLPDSNHNTSTFPLVYFLASDQDFINYFGWQIDLLPCPSAEQSGTRDCERRLRSSARARVRAYVNVCVQAWPRLA